MGVGYISPLPCKFCLSTDVGRQSAKKCRHVKSKDDGNDQVTENAHTCYQGEDGNVALLSCVSRVILLCMPPIPSVDQYGSTDKHDGEGVQFVTGFEEYGRALDSESKYIARINFAKASQLLSHAILFPYLS